MENEAKNSHEAQRGGYRPLGLTLTGFKGIKSGLGRETITLDVESLAGDAALVAIAGANGRGKTTVMDNMHPLC
jgi:exonuclease SbcC